MPVVIQTQAVGTSDDGKLTVTPDARQGVLLKANLGLSGTFALFERINPDGTVVPVRSGDRVPVSGGNAWAYDSEAPLGVPVSWRVSPLSSATGTPGAASSLVTLTLTAPASTSLHSTARPSLLAQIYTEDFGSLSRDTRANVSRVLGRPDPVVTSDVRSLRSLSLTARVDTAEQITLDALLEQASPVLLRPAANVQLPTMYVRVTDDAASGFDRTGRDLRGWELSLVEVARPATAGAPLRIPGKAYSDDSGTYATATGTYGEDLSGL